MKNIHKKKPQLSAEGANLKFHNSKTKRQLAKDFNDRCGYCDDSHNYVGGSGNYHIDHFAPKSKFAELKNNYGNFVYSCPYCNRAKSDKWVGKTPEENVLGDKGFINPCNEEYSKHLKRNDNGQITFVTPLGEYMYTELKLYLTRHQIIHQLEELREKTNLLEQKIESKKNLGQNTHKLEEIYSCLCIDFTKYYNSYCKSLSSVG